MNDDLRNPKWGLQLRTPSELFARLWEQNRCYSFKPDGYYHKLRAGTMTNETTRIHIERCFLSCDGTTYNFNILWVPKILTSFHFLDRFNRSNPIPLVPNWCTPVTGELNLQVQNRIMLSKMVWSSGERYRLSPMLKMPTAIHWKRYSHSYVGNSGASFLPYCFSDKPGFIEWSSHRTWTATRELASHA